jgi:hypothetical protein
MWNEGHCLEILPIASRKEGMSRRALKVTDGRRMALRRAEVTRGVWRESETFQPRIRRLKRSMTTARERIVSIRAYRSAAPPKVCP